MPDSLPQRGREDGVDLWSRQRRDGSQRFRSTAGIGARLLALAPGPVCARLDRTLSILRTAASIRSDTDVDASRINLSKLRRVEVVRRIGEVELSMRKASSMPSRIRTCLPSAFCAGIVKEPVLRN